MDEQKPSATLDNRGLLILEGSSDCAVLVDRNWALVYANPAFQQRFCTAGTAEGTNFLSYLDAPSAARLGDLQAQLLQESRHIELKHLAPDSKAVSLLYSFFPVASSGREVLLAGIGALIAIAIYSEMWGEMGTQERALLILFSLAIAAFFASSLREVLRL